jgi:small subunit ribosomal protein S6
MRRAYDERPTSSRVSPLRDGTAARFRTSTAQPLSLTGSPALSAGGQTHDLLPRKDRGRQTRGGEHVLRHYEIMVILDGSLEERTVAPSLDTYLNVIRTSGGSVEKLDVWGRRRLAYEIEKKTEGIYAVIDLQAEPQAVAELDRQLRLNESVLRTKVIRPEVR